MSRRDTVRQSIMHTHDYGMYIPVGFVTSKRSLNPANLRVIELIGGGVVERNEIHPSLNPVIISSEFVIVGIVAKSLGANCWRIEPISELLQIVCSRFRGNEFVVSDC